MPYFYIIIYYVMARALYLGVHNVLGGGGGGGIQCCWNCNCHISALKCFETKIRVRPSFWISTYLKRGYLVEWSSPWQCCTSFFRPQKHLWSAHFPPWCRHTCPSSVHSEGLSQSGSSPPHLRSLDATGPRMSRSLSQSEYRTQHRPELRTWNTSNCF